MSNINSILSSLSNEFNLVYNTIDNLELNYPVTKFNYLLSLDNTLYYEEKSVIVPNGLTYFFPFSNPIASENDLLVYLNGVLQVKNRDYSINYLNRFIKFLKTAPKRTDVIVFKYFTKWKNTLTLFKLDNCGLEDNKTLIPEMAKIFFVNINQVGKDKQYMEMVDDPVNPSRKVISFVSKSAPSGTSRCQLGCNNMLANELESWVDLYLPSKSWQCLENYPDSIDWNTVLEFWMPFGHMPGVTVTTNPGFRATVGIGKKAGASKLYFFTTFLDKIMYEDPNSDKYGKEKYLLIKSLDDRVAKKFPVPYDKWITLHTKVKVGHKTIGKFMLEIIVDGKSFILNNESLLMQSSYLVGDKYPKAPECYLQRDNCLMKMYSSSTIIDYVAKNSEAKEMRTYWKNISYILRNVDRS